MAVLPIAETERADRVTAAYLQTTGPITTCVFFSGV